MSPIACLCVIVLALYELPPVVMQPQIKGPIVNDFEESVIPPEGFAENRWKRGTAALLVKLGQAAVKYLTKGSWKMKSKDLAFQKYEKVGDFRAALRDFHAVNPSYVFKYTKQNGSTAFEGRVGDRHIFVNSFGEDGRPTIDIIDYTKAKVDIYNEVSGKPIERIIYRESGADIRSRFQ